MFLRMHTLREGLPRTAGTLTAIPGFKCGITLGAALGFPISGFVLMAAGQDNGMKPALAILTSCILLLGAAGGGVGYGIGYGSANLFMKAFPSTQAMRAPLVKPGLAPQFALFGAITFLPIAIKLIQNSISGVAHTPESSSPRP